MIDIENKETVTRSIVALRDMVVFPRITTNLDIGRADSVASVRSASSVFST